MSNQGSDQGGEEELELLEAVITEGIDALETSLEGFAKLRAAPHEFEPLDLLFRGFHSIKGNCAMVGLRDPSEFAHVVEDSIDRIVRNGPPVTMEDVALLEEATDILVSILQNQGSVSGREDDRDRLLDKLAATQNLLPRSQHLQVSDDVPPDAPKTAPPREVAKTATKKDDDEVLRVSTTQFHVLEKLAGDLFHLAERLGRAVRGSAHEVMELVTSLETTTGSLYEQLTDIQRVSPANMTNSLARIVRDTCRKQGKKIEFVVEGKDRRVDRRAVSMVRDGLVHIVRNAVDHGVEPPADRLALGKAEVATVTLSIEDREESVAFVVQDDGRGIDLERVRSKALSLGLIDEADLERLDEQAVIEFIYHPGFSTAAQVSELSGRGVGMNVVAEDVRGSGGQVLARTTSGKGTRFDLIVPKVGSPVVEGLAVRSGGTVYLIRMRSVVMFTDWRRIRCSRSPEGQAFVRCDAGTLPLLSLPRISQTEPEAAVALILTDERGRQAVVRVDEVLGRQRVLTAAVSGAEVCFGRKLEAFVLGNDMIGYVLEVDQLFEHAA